MSILGDMLKACGRIVVEASELSIGEEVKRLKVSIRLPVKSSVGIYQIIETGRLNVDSTKTWDMQVILEPFIIRGDGIVASKTL